MFLHKLEMCQDTSDSDLAKVLTTAGSAVQSWCTLLSYRHIYSRISIENYRRRARCDTQLCQPFKGNYFDYFFLATHCLPRIGHMIQDVQCILTIIFITIMLLLFLIINNIYSYLVI